MPNGQKWFSFRTEYQEVAPKTHAIPSPAIAAPTTPRFLPNAYQIPNPATTSPISSLHSAAATAKTANAASRSLSRYQNAKRRKGVASATGWNSFSVSQPVAG